MPTHHDETLPQRYEREHQAYLKLCGSMTAEQVTDLQLQLNNSMAREQALQALLTAADVLEGLLREALPALDLAAGAFKSVRPIRNKVRAALKPAERTNTSSKAHCPHDGICHTSDETCAEARGRIDSLKPVEGGGDEE